LVAVLWHTGYRFHGTRKAKKGELLLLEMLHILCHPVRKVHLSLSPLILVDRGQGLNHAICDAKTFVEAMKKVKDGETDLQDGIEAYNDDVVKRGAGEVRESLKIAELQHDWDSIMQAPMTHSFARN
jgi:hypothetical protein